ncbi:MAG: hypothetical protein DRO92_04170, partial [Candidatus Altiarchaeales archaeon]
LLIVFGHKSLNYGDRIQGIVNTNWIEYYGNYTIYTDTAQGINAYSITKEVPGDIIVSSITQGDAGLKYIGASSETNVELMLIKLSATTGEDKIITRIKVSLNYLAGIVDADITNARVYIDLGTAGTYDAADIAVSQIISEPSAGILDFTNITGLTIPEDSATNILVVFSHSALNSGDGIQGVVSAGWVEGFGNYTSYTSVSTGTATGVEKYVSSVIVVNVITNGDSGLRYITSAPENNVELMQIKLSVPSGENRVVSSIKISLNYGAGLGDADITNARIYIDKGISGSYDANDILVSETNIEPASGVLQFTNITGLTVKSSASTNILVVIGHNSLSYNESVQGIILTGWIESYGVTTGLTNTDTGPGGSGVIKEVPGEIFVTGITNGDTALKYLLATSQTNVELIQLKLSATIGEDKVITEIRLSLDYLEGINDSDITNLQVFIDRGTSGTYDASDVAVSSIVSVPSAGIALFTNISGLTVKENSITNILIVFGHKALNSGDRIRGVVLGNWITGFGVTTSYTATTSGYDSIGVTKEVPGELYVSSITQGDSALTYLTIASEDYVELMQVKLSAGYGEDKVVTKLRLSLYSDNSTIADSDITNVRLYIDSGTIGTYDGADVLIDGPVTQPSGLVVVFSNISGLTVREQSITNILIVIGHNTLNAGDRIQGVVLSDWVTSYGIATEYTNNSTGSDCYGVTKEVAGRLFVSAITNGDSALKSLNMSFENSVEMLQIRLSSESGENKIVNSIRLSLYSANSSINASDLTNARIYLDAGTSGTYDAADVLVSSIVAQPASLVIQFSNISGLTVFDGNATNILVVIGHKSLSYGDRIYAVVASNWIEYYGVDSLYTNYSTGNSAYGVEKRVPCDIYVSSLLIGNAGIPSLSASPETNAEIIEVKLSATLGEDIRITSMQISLAYGGVADDSDFTNARLFIDIDNDGVYDTGSDIY